MPTTPKILTFFACLMTAFYAGAAERVALVIGNGGYKHATELPNPGNDARLIAGTLRELGFDVIEHVDLERTAMERATLEFSRRANNAKVALVFFAGHGLQLAGKNYLLPIDAKVEDEFALEVETLTLDMFLKSVSGASTRLVVLDACRTNPFVARMRPSSASRNTARSGLAVVDVSEAITGGTLIVYSTKPDDVADDGEGDNSPFSAAMGKYLKQPGLEIRQVLTRVRNEVLKQTENKQEPWDSSSLREDVYLAGEPKGMPAGKEIVLTSSSEFEVDSVMVMGYGYIPSAGLVLPRGRYEIRVKANGYDEYSENEGCWIGEIVLDKDMEFSSKSHDSFLLEDECLISFQEPKVYTFNFGRKEYRFAWHPAGHQACHYSGSLSFINGKRSAIPVRHEMEHDSDWDDKCRGALDSYFEPGGNRDGGASADVTVCADGDKLISIYEEEYRAGEYFNNLFFSEIKLDSEGNQIEFQQLEKLTGDIAANFEVDKFVDCTGKHCRCNATAWIKEQGKLKESDLKSIADILSKKPFDTKTVLPLPRVHSLLNVIESRSLNGISIDSSGMLTRISGHPHGDLWLVLDAMADAYNAFWVEYSGNDLSTVSPNLFGPGLVVGPNRYYPRDDARDADKLFIRCIRGECRLFDTDRLEYSSAFDEAAVVESYEKSGAGIYAYDVNAKLEWQGWLRVDLNDAYLGPVLASIREAGGGPHLTLNLLIDTACADQAWVGQYKNTVSNLIDKFNSVSDPKWEIEWEVDIARNDENGDCVASPSFPANSNLKADWAKFRRDDARAATHLWQAIQASSTDLLIERNSDEDVVGVMSDSRHAKGIRDALDRNVHLSSQMKNPSCVDTSENLTVWRVFNEHSVVSRTPGGYRANAGFTSALLSTGSILVDVRRVNWDYLMYFKPDGRGWRYFQWDFAAQKEMSGKYFDNMPSAWCLIDPLSRTVLSTPSDCPDCEPTRQQWSQ